MKYVEETPLAKFHAWSGANANLRELRKHPAAFNFIEYGVETWCEEEQVTATQINDFLWFDMYDELMEAGYVDENKNWLPEADEAY